MCHFGMSCDVLLFSIFSRAWKIYKKQKGEILNKNDFGIKLRTFDDRFFDELQLSSKKNFEVLESR